jgi:KDO2-lipid IV(A) lauroyltransferase
LPGPRSLARRNVQRAFPELPEERRRQIVRACFERFGSHFCEMVSLSRFSPSELDALFDVSGWEHIEALLQARKPGDPGFFVHTGHYGSWEAALFPLALRLPHFHAVARPPDNPHVAADLRDLRQRFGVTILDKAGAAQQMRSACRAGHVVGVMIDQHVGPTAGIQVPFLGHPAWTSRALASLALRLRVPIVPFGCWPLDGGRYHLEMRPPLTGEGEGDAAVAELTRRVLADVENDVRRKPEWWLWMHRRWRDV